MGNIMESIIDMNLWKEYYSNKENIKKIANYCKYREIVIIRKTEKKDYCTRPLKIFKPEHLEYWIERLHLKETLFDLYRSNISIKLPLLPTRLDQLKEIRPEIDRRYNNMEYITGADYLIDIDASSPSDEEQIINWCKQIKRELVNRGQNPNHIEIWTTGSGGAHLNIPGKFDLDYVKDTTKDIACKLGIPMKNPVKIINGKKYVPKDGEWVKVKDEKKIKYPGKPHIDTSVWDWRRVKRVPHSLHSKYGVPMKRVI